MRENVHGAVEAAAPRREPPGQGRLEILLRRVRHDLSQLVEAQGTNTEFPIPSCREVFRRSFGEMWADTAASYCPKLPKQNMAKPLGMMGWETL